MKAIAGTVVTLVVLLMCMSTYSDEPMHPGELAAPSVDSRIFTLPDGCPKCGLAIKPAPPVFFTIDGNGVMHPSRDFTLPDGCPKCSFDIKSTFAPPAIFTIDGNGIMHPKPLSAIMVSQCGGALALFIQVDANHLLRADPRQSDLFSNVDGKMQQSTWQSMEWGLAFGVASQAVITTHVVVPCDSKEATA